jgi:hypothetical protein
MGDTKTAEVAASTELANEVGTVAKQFKVGDAQGFVRTAEEVDWVAKNLKGRWWAKSSLRRNGWKEPELALLMEMGGVLKHSDRGGRGYFNVSDTYVFIPEDSPEWGEQLEALRFIASRRSAKDNADDAEGDE